MPNFRIIYVSVAARTGDFGNQGSAIVAVHVTYVNGLAVERVPIWETKVTEWFQRYGRDVSLRGIAVN